MAICFIPLAVLHGVRMGSEQLRAAKNVGVAVTDARKLIYTIFGRWEIRRRKPQRHPRSRSMHHTVLPASRSRGAHYRSDARVALMCTTGRMGLSG